MQWRGRCEASADGEEAGLCQNKKKMSTKSKKYQREKRLVNYLLAKQRSQTGHSKGFSFVWLRSWRLRCSRRAKARRHAWQTCGRGLSAFWTGAEEAIAELMDGGGGEEGCEIRRGEGEETKEKRRPARQSTEKSTESGVGGCKLLGLIWISAYSCKRLAYSSPDSAL